MNLRIAILVVGQDSNPVSVLNLRIGILSHARSNPNRGTGFQSCHFYQSQDCNPEPRGQTSSLGANPFAHLLFKPFLALR